MTLRWPTEGPLAGQRPATDLLLAELLRVVGEIRGHQHPTGPDADMFCLNLTSYAGNVMPGVLRRIAELEAEIRQMRDRYTALADEAGNMWRQRAALAAALLEADNPNITAWVEKTVTVPEPYDSGDPAHHRWCSYRCDPSRVAACDCDAESAAQRADIEARAAAPERNWT